MTDEKDPSGLAPNVPGAKLDAGKLRPALVLSGFSRSLTLVCEIGTYGATKYSPNGWRHVPDGEARYMDAFGRHMLAYFRGELMDKSGWPNLAMAAWNILAVLELQETGADDDVL
jgi:hypothetical protein